MEHTTGTKTFAQVRHEWKKSHGGASPDRCTMFEISYTRKNGKPIDEAATSAMNDMKSKIIAIKENKKNNHLPEVVTEEEINEVYAVMLGKEKRDMVRGYGIGVTREDVPCALTERRAGRLDVEAMRDEYEEKIADVMKNADEREERIRMEMRQDNLTTMDKVKELQIMLEKQQALINKLLGGACNPSNTNREVGVVPFTISNMAIGIPNQFTNTHCIEENMTNAGFHAPYIPSPTSIELQHMQQTRDVYRPILPPNVGQ